MATKELDILKRRASGLSEEERLELIESVMHSLRPRQAPQYLKFGKYSGNRLSSPEDFKIAEWRPSDSELNGN